MKLGFATTNAGKARSAREILEKYGIEVEQINLDMPEPRAGLHEIAGAKLDYAINHVDKEYDGLFVVDAGVYVAGMEWPGAFTNF